MNVLQTNYNNGFPYKLDDIRFNDDSYRDAFNNLLLAWGTDFIVSGCDVVSYIVSAGYIMLNGELLKVDSHTIQGAGYFQKQTTYDPIGLKKFKNGDVNNTYQKNRGIAIANSGTLSVNGIRLSELININNIIINVTNNITGTTTNKVPIIGANLSGNTFITTDSNNRLISTKASTDLHSKTIDIGTWNMDTTINVDIIVPTDITTSKIKAIKALIRNDVDVDGGEARYDIGYFDVNSGLLGGSIQILNGNRIRLNRRTGGVFDSVFYSAAGNRGWLTIFYEN
jgi:hypothetical protein